MLRGVVRSTARLIRSWAGQAFHRYRVGDRRSPSPPATAAGMAGSDPFTTGNTAFRLQPGLRNDPDQALRVFLTNLGSANSEVIDTLRISGLSGTT